MFLDSASPTEQKVWSKDLEPQLISDWEKQGIYKLSSADKEKPFVIDTPPPYINAPIHIGHAYTYTWMDAIARHKRLMGYNVVFPIGMDRNGLPIEVQAEKEFKMSILTTPREEYIKNCKLLLEKYENSSLTTFKKLGISFNDWNTDKRIGGAYETDSEEYRRLTQETFIILYKKGLVYESEMPSNYCTECHTTISDSEVEYKEDETNLYHIRFSTSQGSDIIIATTRPELLASCKVLLYNPDDQKNKKFKGHTATVPIFNSNVKIIEHSYADPGYGSGVLMVCSFGDLEDVKILRELKIQPTFVIGKNGKMNIPGSELNGLKIKEARNKMAEMLEANGLLVKTERVPHRYPICWRSKGPIEIIPTKEIYLKQVEYKDALLKEIRSMSFFSPKSRKLLEDWINGISVDWAISRTRYYGTEIPLWYCRKCSAAILPEPGKYYVPWRQHAPVEKCGKCGSTEFVGDERIFDTWFDSATSDLYVSGYLWDKKFFEAEFPVSLRPQGKEIVRSWLYFTVLKSYLLFGKMPFKNVWIHMHVVDEKGEKMSKSLGNVVDPMKIINEFGAEAFRAFAFSDNDITEDDVKCSQERVRAAGKFLTKLWNISRFISLFEKVEKIEEKDITDTDKWVLSVLSETEAKVKELNESYKFDKSAFALRYFTWNIFADHYLELVKKRAYGEGFSGAESKSARYTLHHVLKHLLVLWSPMLPLITEKLWKGTYGKESIHKQTYPELPKDYKMSEYTDKIIAFDSSVWNAKKEKGLKNKDQINFEIPKDLQQFSRDIMSLHSLSNG